jgi:hypothetical protein
VTTAVVASAQFRMPALVLKRTKVSNPRGSGRPFFISFLFCVEL